MSRHANPYDDDDDDDDDDNDDDDNDDDDDDDDDGDDYDKWRRIATIGKKYFAQCLVFVSFTSVCNETAIRR